MVNIYLRYKNYNKNLSSYAAFFCNRQKVMDFDYNKRYVFWLFIMF